MDRKCKCGNFFDLRECSGICPECKTDIFEHPETQNVLGTLNCNYGYNGFKPILKGTPIIQLDKERCYFEMEDFKGKTHKQIFRIETLKPHIS